MGFGLFIDLVKSCTITRMNLNVEFYGYYIKSVLKEFISKRMLQKFLCPLVDIATLMSAIFKYKIIFSFISYA